MPKYTISTAMDVNKLIGLVAERRTIWREQKNSHFRQEAKKLWSEIGQQMGCSGFLARLKWQNLRDTFRRECTKTKRLEAEGQMYVPTWKHFQALSFLHEVPYTTKLQRLGQSTSQDSLTIKPIPVTKNFVSLPPSLVPITPNVVSVPVPSSTVAVTPSLVPITPSVVSVPKKSVNVTPSLIHISPSVAITHVKPATPRVVSNYATATPVFATHKNWSQPETDPLSEDSLSITNVVSLKEEIVERTSHSAKAQEKMDFAWESPTMNSSSPPQDASVQDDEDYHFLLSLLPHLKEIPRWRKLAVRQKLQNVLIEEQVPP